MMAAGTPLQELVSKADSLCPSNSRGQLEQLADEIPDSRIWKAMLRSVERRGPNNPRAMVSYMSSILRNLAGGSTPSPARAARALPPTDLYPTGYSAVLDSPMMSYVQSSSYWEGRYRALLQKFGPDDGMTQVVRELARVSA